MTFTYAAIDGSTCIARSDGACIPTDPNNTDYQAYLTWVAAGNVATPPSLAVIQTAQVAVLNLACAAAIYAGFSSSALGTAYSYPAKDTDQQNLASSVLSSLMPNLVTGWTTPFWCENALGVWAFVPHTAAQIQKVGEDAKTAILTCMAKNATLAAQVMAASTAAAVTSIAW